ncbi:MAG TPA: hydroxymethylbilane synthase, partial [Solirubrobacteraceae bacterium]
MRVGTRGSALALAQAGTVAALLGPDVELVTVTTSGDRASAAHPTTASDANDKERWVKEIELALLAGEIDLAVHSAKDVPSVLPDGLELVGAPRRADPFDALVGADALERLAPGARVGTASLRRASQLRALREDLAVVVLRGNVDTRLRRLADGDADALLLAAAGLQRLGRDDATGAALAAERALVRALDADCHTPVGAHAVPEGDGRLRLRA